MPVSKRFSFGGFLVPALVLAGLGVGFLREVYLAFLFGVSTEVEVIRVAMGLPSILSDGLAVSFVSVLIPVFLMDRPVDQTLPLREAVWAVLFVGFAVAMLGWITMPMQARLLAPGFLGPDQATLILAGRMCWVMFLTVLLSLVLRAWLSVENVVWPGAGAQLFRSLGFVVALFAIHSVLGKVSVLSAAIAAIVGGVTVLAVHVYSIGKKRRRQVWLVLLSGPNFGGTRPILLALGLVIMTQLLLSAGRIIDRAVASEMPAGTLATVEYSYGLIMAATAVLGTSANLVLAPRIGRALRDYGAITAQVKRQITLVSAAAFGIGLVLFALGDLPVKLVFQHGQFDADAVRRTGQVFRLHALALGPLVLSLILTQILLLNGSQKWVVFTAIVKLAVKGALLGLLLGFGWGIQGLAISLGLTELMMVVILGSVLAKRRNRQKGAGRC